MLLVSYHYSGNNSAYIVTQVDSIVKLNRILSLVLQVYHEFILNLMNMNTFIVRNTYADLNMDEHIVQLADSVATSDVFVPEYEGMLAENLCTYYAQTDGQCEDGLKGIARQGTRALILSIANQFKIDRAALKGKTYTVPLALELLLRPYGRETYNLVNGALLPGIRVFIKKIGAALVNDLEQNLADIIKAFWASIFVNMGSLVGMVLLVYRKMKKEREMIVKTLKFVPLDFIMENTELRLYLIKERPEFSKLFKYMEGLKRERELSI